MDRNVLEFIDKLRIGGLRVSTSETLDCIVALEYVDNTKARKEVMAATLVKRASDLSVFEKIYNIYYEQQADCLSGTGKEGQIQLDNVASFDNTSQNFNKQKPKSGWKELFNNIKDKQEKALNDAVNAAVEGLGELKQQDAHNFNNLVRRTQIAMEWFMAQNQLQRSYWDMPYEEWLEAKEQFQSLKQKIEEALRKKVQEELGIEGQDALLKQLNLNNKSFGDLGDEEIIEMEKRVTLLGKRLASRLGRRLKRSKRGLIDIRRIIRKAAISPDFVPYEFDYLKKKPAKPKIAVLCDISGSVARYSRFMLQMIYFLANRFSGIKAYVFIDGIVEVTDVLRQANWENAFDQIFRESKCSISGYSDYGKVFESFNKQYLIDIDKKTTLVVLGDARNNWYPTGIEEFIIIAKKSKRVIWLNPQEKEMWDQDDSIISVYEKHINNLEECRNLGHLERVVKKILAW